MIVEAIKFANERHATQKRKSSGLPYIVHPIEVMKKLSDWGVATDEPVLVAAVLHDVVEDTETSLMEIDDVFGFAVAKLVGECTKDSFISKKEYMMSFGRKTSVDAYVLKCADRVCNINDFRPVNRKYAAKYALQAYPVLNWFFGNRDLITDAFGEKVSNSIEYEFEKVDMLICKAYNDIEIIKWIYNAGKYDLPSEHIEKIEALLKNN